MESNQQPQTETTQTRKTPRYRQRAYKPKKAQEGSDAVEATPNAPPAAKNPRRNNRRKNDPTHSATQQNVENGKEEEVAEAPQATKRTNKPKPPRNRKPMKEETTTTSSNSHSHNHNHSHSDHHSKQDLSQHSELAADIISKLNSHEYECAICCETIKHQVAIWGCENCYRLFHLFCIKKWSRAGDAEDAVGFSFRCPGCQFVYVTRPKPKCYCGKMNDPPFNPYVTPHSCGETCGKMRTKTDCPHPCSMMCHPGHCPPCSALGPIRNCFCGKIQYRLRCGEKDPGRSCGETCDRILNCGRHHCKVACHQGPCDPCEVVKKQTCYCGKVTEDRLCGSGKSDNCRGSERNFACGQVCGLPLSCGNHTCQEKCHMGPCKECPTLPSLVSTCPCGKIPLELLSSKKRTSCLDEIPTCPNQCEKKLSCGIHACKRKCHHGPCDECTAEVKVPCRCHATSHTRLCKDVNGIHGTPILCNKICKKFRSCGHHQCGLKCCPSSAQADPRGLDPEGVHVCSMICGKKLKCGKHTCDLLCHQGKCLPCHVTIHERYVCECGHTTLDPPIFCGTKLPECKQDCVRVRPCGHPTRHPCHSRESACPPCAFLTQKLCVGGHEIRKNIPCYVNEVSCGKTCNKPLSCGQHLCKRICHSGPCTSQQQEENSEKFISCGQSCGKPRKFCPHSCAATCHPDVPHCPPLPCKQLITIYCPCKRRSTKAECMRGGEDDGPEKRTRELLCDEQCEKEEQNRKLAEALGISPNRILAVDYSDFLKNAARTNLSFVLRIEKQFDELIRGSKAKHGFPPMDRIQRQIVHELAGYYNLDSESFDREPVRNVVVTKKRESKVPPLLLSVAKNEPSRHPEVSEEHFALQIFDIDPDMQTQHVMSFLYPFEGQYQMKWIDNSGIIIEFKSHVQAKAAYNALTNGPWKVKEMQQIPSSSASSTGLTAKGKDFKPLFKEYKPQEESWRKENNFFATLLAKNKSTTEQDNKWGDEEDLKFAQDPMNTINEINKEMSKLEMESNSNHPVTSSNNNNIGFLPSVDDWEETDMN